MSLRYEAWSPPWDPGGFKRKIAMLPIIDGSGQGSVEFMSVGGDSSADISLANFDRMDDLVSDTESSLVTVYDCQEDGTQTIIDEWVLDRVPQRLAEDRSVALAGPNLLREAMDKALVYAFDYPKSPSVQRDHIWGKNQDDDTTGLIQNGTFEDVPMPNGGFEDGNAGHWQGTEDDGDLIGNGAISAVSSATDARTGSWYGLVNPLAQGGGARRSISGLVPGENYTITGWINEPSGSGDRLRAGIIGASTATHTNAYEEPVDPDVPGIWWAEIGNASQGNGASTGAYQSVTLTFKPETDHIELVIIYDDVNDRTFRIDDWAMSGDNVGLDPWVPFRNSNAQGGALNIGRQSTAQAHTGAGSCHIQGVDGPYYDVFGRIGYGTFGITQPVRMVPGRLYTMTAWVRHDGSGANGANELLRIVLNRRTPKGAASRTLTGDFLPGPGSYYMANATVSVPQNTWTKIQMTVVADVAELDAQVRYAGTSARNNDVGTFDSPNIFIDDVSIHEGLPATTIGDIWQFLLDDCTIKHANDTRGTILEWLDYSSFDATNDSNGIPWNEDIPFLARWGSTMGHVLDDTFDRGYEAELVRKATPVGGKTHDFHLYNTGGRDDDPATAIHTGQPLLGGDSIRRNPAYTSVLVASPDGSYTEDSDATTLADFGRMETFRLDSEASGPISRQILADNLLAFEEANRKAVRFEVVEASGIPRPFVDYRPGDTIPMTMAPGLLKEDRRVQRIDYVNTQPTQYSVVGSRIVEGEAAAFDLVARLWRRLQRPGKFNDPDVGLGLGGEKVFVIDVAAADAPEWEKAIARYQCDGVDDHAEIFEALFETTPSITKVVQLSSGTFFVDSGQLDVRGNVHLRGMGQFATLIRNQQIGTGVDQPRFTGDYLIEVEDEGELSDIGFDTTFGYLGSVISGMYGTIHDVMHVGGNAHSFIWWDGTIHPGHQIQSWANYNKAMIVLSEGWLELNGVLHAGSGPTIYFEQGSNGTLSISNIVVTNTEAPGMILEGPGGVVISNYSYQDLTTGSDPTQPAIQLDGVPFDMAISNVFANAKYLIEGLPGSGVAELLIHNAVGNVSESVIKLPNAGDLSMDHVQFGVDGSNTLDAIAIASSTGNFRLSNFRFTGFRGNGISIKGALVASQTLKIHDGYVSSWKHGLSIDTASGFIHDVDVDAGLEASNTYDAFHLKGLMIGLRVQDNNILNSSRLRYGINITEAGIERAIVVGNSGGDPSDFGTDALNDQGTDTQLTYPSDPTYGDNFFRSGSSSGADQIEQVTPPTQFPNREFESARPVTPVQS